MTEPVLLPVDFISAAVGSSGIRLWRRLAVGLLARGLESPNPDYSIVARSDDDVLIIAS